MATNEKLKTHCYYTMYNKVSGEYKDVTISHPWNAEKAKKACVPQRDKDNKTALNNWIVIAKGFY